MKKVEKWGRTTLNPQHPKYVLGWMLCLAILLCCELFFFRNVINGSGALIGDEGDGRLTTLFAEHWYHVFCGESSVTDMGIFFPMEDTIAYSDMFFILGVLHSMMRFIGFDMYRAYKATVILIHIIGSLGTFYLLRKTLKVSYGWSLFGVMAFSFTGAFATLLIRTQFVMVAVLPFFGIVVTGFIRNLERRVTRNVYAALFLILFAATLYTAWYIAFFVMLFGTTIVIIAFASRLINGRPIINPVVNLAKQVRWDAAIYLLVFAGFCIPFALAELPILSMSGGRTYDEVWINLPEPIDFINVSSSNKLLGSILSSWGLSNRQGIKANETVGLNIVLLVTMLAESLVLRFRAARDTRSEKELRLASRNAGCAIVLAAVIVSCVFLVRLSQNGVSLWWFLYSFFPGGSSIRSPARYLLFLSFPLSVIAAVYGNMITSKLSRGTIKNKFAYGLMMGILLTCLFISNVNGGFRTGGVYATWNAESQMESMALVPLQPSDCRSFFIVNIAEDRRGFLGQIDAYEIADALGTCTINGHSGLYPAGYGAIEFIDSEEYLSAVDSWIGAKGLENVYCYNVGEKTWTRYC